jgi:hypothetical protein
VIGFGLLNLLVTAVLMGGAGDPMMIGIIIGSVIGFLLGSIYYGLMIYFLSRPAVIEAMD